MPHDRRTDLINHPMHELTKAESISVGERIRALENAVEEHLKATGDTDRLRLGQLRKAKRLALTQRICEIIEAHGQLKTD